MSDSINKIHTTSNALLIWALLLFLTGGIVGVLATREVYRMEAIDRGFAIYNPTNAVFQWNK